MHDPFPSWARRAAVLAAAALPALAAAQGESAATFSPAQQRGVAFLLAHQEDGKFLEQDKPHLGISALALAAVATKPVGMRTGAENEYVAAATEFVLGAQNEDGSFGESNACRSVPSRS